MCFSRIEATDNVWFDDRTPDDLTTSMVWYVSDIRHDPGFPYY